MKVMVAMSGGVDSSVAAALLLEEGHEVIGATLKLWGGASDSGCCSVADVEDARRVAAQLDVDHLVFDDTAAFDTHVVAPYVADHAAGRTPNPCVECNRHLKFDLLARRARRLGFDAVATGHHARVVTGADGEPRIARGADRAKDQSYVLHMLRGDDLDRVLLPVGELTKAEVRLRAEALGLRTADKAESQDVCFVTRAEGRAAFLAERVQLHPATVLDTSGQVLGDAPAVELVTVGQRRGLHLAGGAGRRFVTAVDVGARTVTVGEPADLLVDATALEQVVWTHAPADGAALAQCSAHGPATAVEVEVVSGDGHNVALHWEQPQRRVAPGQSVVLYRGDVVLGGGIAT